MSRSKRCSSSWIRWSEPEVKIWPTEVDIPEVLFVGPFVPDATGSLEKRLNESERV